ncbi:sensor histidine kinase [Bailinhaonella thermotolerans]|uniref:histidine kinase n=1 Tax=Bailinhaonella thermotolerans TaxID=1070861 RepID=A0A3A4AFS8_9ACTN|nr:sensor histidine kinase [Bailinhaonella thermotolerans]RJL24493.1 sensor histidine kinase [Bailinhaonella thermotolerans]
MTGVAAAPRQERRPLRERVPLGPYGPLGLFVDPRTWRAVPYLLIVMCWGAACTALVVAGTAVSLALTVVWIGFPMLAVVMIVWRGAAMLERRLLRLAFGVSIPDPYAPLTRRRPLGWPRVVIRDRATWKDFCYLALLFPLGTAEFVTLVILGNTTSRLLLTPVDLARHGYAWPLPELDHEVRGTAAALAWAVAGLGVFVVTMYVVRGFALAHAWWGAFMLGTGEKERLVARAAHLRASRARAVDAAEAERRRIERDLHDGAQQRLLAVAMELGRAQVKIDEDPAAAKEMIASAHAGARAAIAELRDLARGIYPAILTDRGLDAALSHLAARAPIPVDVSVEIRDRPPAAVESIAYFIVSESLANMAKHARAERASVVVCREGERVVVEVRDNGVGGAVPTPGGGLAGLADRAATIDGTLTVLSPPGGPTLIRADLPCEW